MKTTTINGMLVGLLYPLDAEAQMLITDDQCHEAIDRNWFVMIDSKDQTMIGFIDRRFLFGDIYKELIS